MRGRRIVAIIGAVLALVVPAAACSSSGSSPPSNAVPPPAPPQARVVYVALGGDETVNRQLDDSARAAWTQQVFGDGMPTSAVYVNVARPNAHVREGLEEQVPVALGIRPTVVTLWFGYADARTRTDPATFSQDLTAIVRQLRTGGVEQVLLLSRTDPGAGPGSQYAREVEQVASATGAVFVALPGGMFDAVDPATQDGIAAAVRAHLP